MATIEHIRNYKVSSDDKFFFDNNVWMLLFSSAISGSRPREQRVYGNLLKSIVCANATIFINSLVASEYVNTNLRLHFQRWQRLPENFGRTNYKYDYRPSQAFLDCRDTTYAELAEILKISFRKPDDFNAIQPSEILGALGDRMDFNDAYFASFCNLNKLILVTDDRDLFDTPLNIKILTSQL